MTPTRRTLLAAAAPALASVGGMLGSSAPATARPDAAAADPEIAALVERATQAHVALMQGNLERYRSLIRISDDFTLMAPFGGKPTRGTEMSTERWTALGRFFGNGRDSTLELVQAYRAADLVVLAVIERTHAEVGGLAAQRWPLRVTLVFRRDGGQWQLVHRHADPLADGIGLQQAAAIAAGRAS